MMAELWWEMWVGLPWNMTQSSPSHVCLEVGISWGFLTHIHLVIVSARERTGVGYVLKQTHFLLGALLNECTQG